MLLKNIHPQNKNVSYESTNGDDSMNESAYDLEKEGVGRKRIAKSKRIRPDRKRSYSETDTDTDGEHYVPPVKVRKKHQPRKLALKIQELAKSFNDMFIPLNLIKDDKLNSIPVVCVRKLTQTKIKEIQAKYRKIAKNKQKEFSLKNVIKNKIIRTRSKSMYIVDDNESIEWNVNNSSTSTPVYANSRKPSTRHNKRDKNNLSCSEENNMPQYLPEVPVNIQENSLHILSEDLEQSEEYIGSIRVLDNLGNISSCPSPTSSILSDAVSSTVTNSSPPHPPLYSEESSTQPVRLTAQHLPLPQSQSQSHKINEQSIVNNVNPALNQTTPKVVVSQQIEPAAVAESDCGTDMVEDDIVSPAYEKHLPKNVKQKVKSSRKRSKLTFVSRRRQKSKNTIAKTNVSATAVAISEERVSSTQEDIVSNKPCEKPFVTDGNDSLITSTIECKHLGPPRRRKTLADHLGG